MNKAAIIVAGGIGSRMGSNIPKQFMQIKGKPVLMHTIEKFIEYDSFLEIIVTLPENQIQTWANLCVQHKFNCKHITVAGGITRFHSVCNALEKISSSCEIIAVHDGVRPLISIETIANCFNIAKEKGTAVPVLQISESMRKIHKTTSEPVSRDEMYIVQTPQAFHRSIIMHAYSQAYIPEFTDDASVVEKAGFAIQFTKGHRENIKITFPDDIVFAENFL